MALLKMVSGETAPLTKIEGKGVCYLADNAKNVTILRLQGETINVNGNDLLAFENSVELRNYHAPPRGWCSVRWFVLGEIERKRAWSPLCRTANR